MLDLTITDADHDDKAVNILRSFNEKIAISTYLNGLKDNDLRTIVRARNYLNLKDTIIGTKEEEIVKKSTSSSDSNLYYSQGRNSHFSKRSFIRGHGVNRTTVYTTGNTQNFFESPSIHSSRGPSYNVTKSKFSHNSNFANGQNQI